MNHVKAIAAYLLLSGLFAAEAVWAQSAQNAEGKMTSVEVKADSLQIESEQKTARFVGNVRAVIGELRFFCSKMTITYNDAGEIISLIASGGVTVMKDGAKAVANRAEMHTGSRRIVLSGNPTLTRDGNTLKGKSIEVNLQTGKIQVTEAVGTFVIPKGAVR
ncbi:MAG: hypothetical protein JXX29_13340 [Deltaproteobacteria bacterium]|nr:hypothetical protein [Deltaproteobacteria bacterium]MBN2672663.1 hypothetical protein [Deltaproteobacteria bacterium]